VELAILKVVYATVRCQAEGVVSFTTAEGRYVPVEGLVMYAETLACGALAFGLLSHVGQHLMTISAGGFWNTGLELLLSHCQKRWILYGLTYKNIRDPRDPFDLHIISQ
jgi:hypothetical protein